MLPADRLVNLDSTAYTNKAGDIISQTTTTSFVNGKWETTNFTEIPKVDIVGQRVHYVLVDEDIAWDYRVQFKPDGSVDYVMESRRDAKEYDPKYSQTIREVEDEVKARLEKGMIPGRHPSVHGIWLIMRTKLKDKGIDWHSPAELNPNPRY